jgi:hypothetical protein
MAFDLYVWKWTSCKEDTDRAEIFEALNEDDPHPALTRFDVRSFELRAITIIDAPWIEIIDGMFSI